MRSLKIFSIIITLSALASCRKYDLLRNDTSGEGLGPFTLKSPGNNANILLNSGNPTDKIIFEWNAAKPGIKTTPEYYWLAALKNGSFDQPLLMVPSDANGKTPKLSISQKTLDDLLKSKGIADAAKTDLKWTVLADNGVTKLTATDSFFISITRFGEGASPFALYGPASSTNVITINPGSSSDSMRFKWQASVPGKSTSPVKYKVQFSREGSTS